MKLHNLTSNYLINLAIISWCSAQTIKVILTLIKNKKLQLERLVGAGGMPSAHSAMVCSVAAGACNKFGFSSPIFALAITVALIVMYDAMGVRYAASKHAKAINDIVDIIKDDEDFLKTDNKQYLMDILKNKLNESLGHKPIEVVCGAILGIVLVLIIPIP